VLSRALSPEATRELVEDYRRSYASHKDHNASRR
jgi:hypothetical protein